MAGAAAKLQIPNPQAPMSEFSVSSVQFSVPRFGLRWDSAGMPRLVLLGKERDTSALKVFFENSDGTGMKRNQILFLKQLCPRNPKSSRA